MKQNNALHGTYAIKVSGYDWGSGVNEVILTLDKPIDNIERTDILVTETKKITNFLKLDFPIEEVTVDRSVESAYLCNQEGVLVEKPSRYIALTLYVSPNDGSPFLFDMNTQFNTWSVPYQLNFSLANNKSLKRKNKEYSKIIIDSNCTSRKTSADMFKMDTYTSTSHITYDYAYYIPSQQSDTLVVWLHGLGEGGNVVVDSTDLYITLLGNKVTALAKEEFQTEIGYAHILVPQCPTYWMDADGKMSNFNGGEIIANGSSYYQESLNELITFYKNKINAKKVVLVGCSNGGYMTLLMAINYPNEYDAIVPICEALPDKLISNEQIEIMKDIPMFFIYSLDDQVIDPKMHEIPTIERLKKAGATNLHVFTSEHVVDTSGNYKNEIGEPYQYMGHWSWIYFYNNEANSKEQKIPVFTWIKKQIK